MKCAVAGLGVGMAHVAGYLTHRRCELVAVADPWQPRRGSTAGTFAQGSMLDMRRLFEDRAIPRDFLDSTWQAAGIRVYESAQDLAADAEIELVSLCTPDDTHAALIHELLAAGKYVLAEKPVSLTAADARAIADLPGAQERLAVGYEFRVNPAVRALKQRIDDEELGTVRAVSLHHYRTPFRRNKWQSWIQDPARSGGLVVEETCHWFDLVAWLAADRIATVHCVGVDDIHADFAYEDLAYVQGRYQRGGAWQIAHSLSGFDFSLVIQVHGSRAGAWLALKDAPYSALDAGASDHCAVLSVGLHNQGPTDAQVTTWGVEATEPYSIRDSVHAVVDSFLHNSAPPAGIAAGRDSLLAALGARESLVSGHQITIEE